MRIALFITCFNDALFPGTGRAMARVLERLGHELHFPPDQTCCGQIHFNTGYRSAAFRQLESFLRIFRDFEAVVAPSASCVSMVREQYPTLASEAGDQGLESEARALGKRVFELSELLVGRWGVEDVGATLHARVALHPTCHSLRGIDVGDGPERLLRRVRGLELVDLPNALECCGFGGTFSVKQPETSLAMLDDKIKDLRRSGAEVLTAVDNSCLMHIAGGLRRRGLLREGGGRERRRKGMPGQGRDPTEVPVRVMHLAEILARREGGVS